MEGPVSKVFFDISECFFRWIDVVTELVVRLRERFIRRRVLKFTEDGAGELVVRAEILDASSPIPSRIKSFNGKLDQAVPPALVTSITGSRVELTLQPDRFLFQPLELPNRAADFLQGIVRTQIDRLTPWNTSDVAFGWSQPRQMERDRIVITVAATAISSVKPYVQAMTARGARSVGIFTHPPEDCSATPIKIWEENARDEAEVRQIRRVLLTLLATAGILAGVASGASAITGASLDAQQNKLSHQIASIRARMGALPPAASDAYTTARVTLERRKREVPSTVMLLDTLSRILPDTTHVTELRIEGDKLRLVGNTSDAPSLIGLMEQSGRFSRASFFAPTTRTASETTERFHIEAIILPLGVSQS